MLENQVEVRQREVVDLQSQVKTLGQDESDGRRQLLENKFQELLDPLRRRRNFLVASREVHQFNRDMEDEIVRSYQGAGLSGLSDLQLTVCLSFSCGSRSGWLWLRPLSTATTYRRSSCSSKRTRCDLDSISPNAPPAGSHY